MNDPIKLRGGEVIRPEEFPKDHLDEMHTRLDVLAPKDDRGNERFMRVASTPAFAILAGVVFGIGFFNSTVGH